GDDRRRAGNLRRATRPPYGHGVRSVRSRAECLDGLPARPPTTGPPRRGFGWPFRRARSDGDVDPQPVRRRLDTELVRRGLAPSRARAVDAIRAGRVLVGG